MAEPLICHAEKTHFLEYVYLGFAFKRETPPKPKATVNKSLEEVLISAIFCGLTQLAWKWFRWYII